MTWGSRFRFALLASLALVLVTPSSCNKSGPYPNRKPVFPVHGLVRVDGRPAAGGRVVFVPGRGEDEQTPRPNAGFGSDGSFPLSTYEAHDGAPAGSYKVSIHWRLPSKDDPGQLEPDLLRGQYID